MGQYFKAVNLDKREYVCPWCLSGGAKLWEWAANPQGAVFILLLRQSDAGGGGDYYGYPPQTIVVDDSAGFAKAAAEAVRWGVAQEGRPIHEANETLVGRWAGDRVALVGDYDSSNLWKELPKYRNISEQLVEEWNRFIELSEMQLTFRDCGCLNSKED